MPRLDIGSLEALCAIADHGGITRAAEHLALSQSAISHKIKRLEQGLGYEILDRRASASKFTAEGEQLLVYGRRILAIHEEALISLTRRPLRGRLRLGVSEDIAAQGLPSILGHFKKRYPEVGLRTTSGQSLKIAEQLDRRKIDIGVFETFEQNTRTTDTLLRHTPLHWVKAPDFQLDWSKPIPFLAYDQDCFYREWAMQIAVAQHPGFDTILTCASSSAIISAVASGLGVALVSERCLTPEIEVITGTFPEPATVASVIRVSRHVHSDAALALKDSITQAFVRSSQAARKPLLHAG